MNVPGDSKLSNEEIVRFIDVSSADVLPGWVPSEHYNEDSMVIAWRQAQEGDKSVLDLMTQSRSMARLVMAGHKLLGEYEADDAAFGEIVTAIVGADINEALATFFLMRSDVMAQRVSDWDKPQSQLAMFQLDSFLLGWMLAKNDG